MSRALGKGFDALIPQNFDESILAGPKEQIEQISLSKLRPNPEQPRQHFEKSALDELAASIKRHGVVQPLVVTPDKNDGFIIIAGERRWRASKLAGVKTVPAVVRTSEQLERLELALVENVQRVDLSPLEQAVSIERLNQQFNIGYEDIAKRLGKAQTTITNIVRLLGLPEEAKKALQNNEISEGHARTILSIKDPARQKELLNLIKSKHLSVRQAEQYVTAHKKGARSHQAAEARLKTTNPQTEKLGKQLKTKVSIKRTAKGGKLEIGFKNESDLLRIIKYLLKY